MTDERLFYVHLDFAGALPAHSREEAEEKAKAIIVDRLHGDDGVYLIDLSPVHAEVTEEGA